MSFRMVRGLFHSVHLLDLDLSIRLKALFVEPLFDRATTNGLVGSSIHRGMSSGRPHLVLLDLALYRL